MLEWIRFRHYLGAQAESYRATLHVNDGMVSIFSGWRRRETYHVFGFHLSHHLLEGEGRNVMALIHDDLAVVRDKILYSFFLIQALDDRNIDAAAATCFSAANLTD